MDDLNTQEPQAEPVSLRDTIEAELTKSEAPVEDVPRETKPREPDGKFAKADKVDKVADKVAEPAQRPNRPSSWKKDYWEDWDKLDPKVAAYIQQREGEFSSGISTYKSEFDKVKPIQDAIAPFLPDLEKHGIQPGTWIQNLGIAHKKLALGSPQEKMQAFQKLAQDYGINLQGFNGQPDQLTQYVNPLYEQVRQLQGQFQSYQQAQEQQAQQAIQKEIELFKQSAPHLEEVRETMAGLLQSGVAHDLQTAYDKAVRLNDDIWQKTQEEASQGDAARKAAEATAAASRARAKNLSPKSSTTGANMANSGKKGLRASLEDAVESALGGGRV